MAADMNEHQIRVGHSLAGLVELGAAAPAAVARPRMSRLSRGGNRPGRDL
jgi:hypothetical protein